MMSARRGFKQFGRGMEIPKFRDSAKWRKIKYESEENKCESVFELSYQDNSAYFNIVPKQTKQEACDSIQEPKKDEKAEHKKKKYDAS